MHKNVRKNNTIYILVNETAIDAQEIIIKCLQKLFATTRGIWILVSSIRSWLGISLLLNILRCRNLYINASKVVEIGVGIKNLSPSPNPGTYLVHVPSSTTTYMNGWRVNVGAIES